MFYNRQPLNATMLIGTHSLAFTAAIPLSLRGTPTSFCCASSNHHLHCARPVRAFPRATFSEDFLTGPCIPSHPRPLHKVILFSSLTGLLWYGWYKFCVEEDLRATLSSGPGGYLALGPFVAGVLSPLVLPTGGPAETGVALGVLWIVAVQYSLYGRINTICERAGLGTPLVPQWVVLPGFNLLVGLRSIHFLALANGEKGKDPVVERLPFLGVPTLGILQLITTPKLWFKL